MFARLLLCLFLVVGVACVVPASEKATLVSLHAATAGQYWITKWNTTGDPCDDAWNGINCNASKTTVQGLSLVSNNLTGTLVDLQLPNLNSLFVVPSD